MQMPTGVDARYLVEAEAAICLTFCSGVWVRALFAYGTRSAVRRMTLCARSSGDLPHVSPVGLGLRLRCPPFGGLHTSLVMLRGEPMPGYRPCSGGDQTENLAKMAQHSGKSQQPFVSPLAWAYFSAYQTVVIGAYMRAKVLEIGMERFHKVITDEPIKNVLKTALPYYSQFIDEQPVGAYHLLLDDLEKHLIAELQKMIRGDEQDQASVEQAARIMEMVEKASATQAEQEVGAGAALS
jgi:DNA-binding protein Fis